MAKINFSLTADLDEVISAIEVTGEHVTNIIISEPGVGKSSILKMLEEKHGDAYDYIYVDCPVKDMMDVAASIPNHETKSLEYYVSSLFKLDSDKPKIIMLDEFMKAPKLLSIIFTRLMLERSVGDKPLPKGSIVFGTSNNTTDGVGDAMLAHAGNRVCKIHMKKPNAEKWNAWAGANGVPRPIRAWVAMNPRALASYTDGDQDDNPYIFKPGMQGQFVSPRSLYLCGFYVANKDKITPNMLAAGLAGTVGEAAAKSMAAFVQLEEKLIRFDEIVQRPDTVTVPEDVSALIMMMFEAVDSIKGQDDLTKYMTFVNRIRNTEVQAVFFTMMIRSKPRVARYNQAITKWAAENHYVM
jgi:hypothetical protein